MYWRRGYLKLSSLGVSSRCLAYPESSVQVQPASPKTQRPEERRTLREREVRRPRVAPKRVGLGAHEAC